MGMNFLTHCNALQRAATRCNALQRAATRCNALQHAFLRQTGGVQIMDTLQIMDMIIF